MCAHVRPGKAPPSPTIQYQSLLKNNLPMNKIGMCMPYHVPGYRYDRKHFLGWCRRLDEGPFSSVSCGERICGHSYEMRSLMAAAAAVTERIRLVPTLYVLPMHDAAWAAKEIATMDMLSEGRITLTVGVGGREKDYRAVNASFARRHQRMDEQVALMRRIWKGESPVPGLPEIGPPPVQEGGPPILIGAMGPKSMRRGAEWADGLYAFSLDGKKEEIQTMLQMADDAWQAAGRQERPFRVGGFWFSLAPDAKKKLHHYVADYMEMSIGEKAARQVAAGMTRHTPEAVLQGIKSLEELDCDEIYLVPATAEYAEIEEVEKLLANR